MSYYTDLDNDLGAYEEAERDCRELEYERRRKDTARMRTIKNEVAKQLKKLGVDTVKKEARGARGARVGVYCACCGNKFEARVADRKRGWGKFCSKSCKAIKQRR